MEKAYDIMLRERNSLYKIAFSHRLQLYQSQPCTQSRTVKGTTQCGNCCSSMSSLCLLPLDDQMSCPVTARDRCWAPASWLSPATGLARRPPSRHHCHQVQRLFSSSSSMFSQHIRSLLVIFFPKLPMNMSVGWTMPPIPAPLLLPKELLVPYALHLGNWICSSYRSTSPMQRVLKHKASPELHTSVWLPASISLWH